MKDETKWRAEQEIKSKVIVSRDRSIQSREFQELFEHIDDYNGDKFSGQTRQLWIRLSMLVIIIRKRPGATMDELILKMSLDAGQVRQCIRLLITLGGEIEVICEDWQCASEGRFFLHN